MGGKGSGRRPKPVEQKIRLGNLGQRKLPKHADIVALPSLASDVPEPHRPLGTHGKELWHRIWSSGAAWLRPALDGDIVLMACEMTDERTVLRQIVFTQSGAWRERRALREIDRQITSLLSQIGFSPTDRATLGIGEHKQHEFAKIRQRIEAKRAAANE
ncbi:MAG: hypothetical protein EBZ61_11395 [Micrococcales bacterium]|nr:hypothetical protein [Micrococcales bacterium]